MAMLARFKKNSFKAQFSLEYLLSVVIVISLISAILLMTSNYSEDMVNRYENAIMKSVLSDVSYTITNIYIKGYESEYKPAKGERAVITRCDLILPREINRKSYDIEINDSENMVCGYIDQEKICFKTVGVPLGFNITDNIAENRTLNIVYYRERNDTHNKIDYILVS